MDVDTETDTPGQAITFDFHETLAHCPRWFDLEVRHLVSDWLRWRAAQSAAECNPETLDAADAAYRRLRIDIMDHGNEEPAERCVALVLDELGLPVEASAIERGVEELMRGTLDDLQPTAGAVETVRALADAGVPIGIVSSAVYHPFLLWSLERFGILDAFADVTTSASAGYYKGRPELWWHAVGRLGAQPDRVVHIGDSAKWDVAGARQAGLRPVWLRRGEAVNDTGVEPLLTVASLEGAAPFLLGLLRHGDGNAR